MKYPKTLELVIGTEKKPLELGTLEGARAEPIRYFVDCIRNHKTVEGVVSGDFNVNVMQIVEKLQDDIDRLNTIADQNKNINAYIKIAFQKHLSYELNKKDKTVHLDGIKGPESLGSIEVKCYLDESGSPVFSACGFTGLTVNQILKLQKTYLEIAGELQGDTYAFS